MDPQPGTQADPLIGQTIGNYRVTEKLGEGGMGAVYLAEHPTIGKKVALKVLHAQFSNNEEVAQRFFHEAKAVNNIGHPNIVDIVDYGMIEGYGKDKEQLFYFIMEYLGGQSLSALVRNESPLPPERALGICMQVADALAASHKCGIVHRDLKPDNIMLQQRGRERDFVKLLDFGIAKVTEQGQQSRTRTGIVMGTPAYMSPEQCEGKANVDARTDVYALGIVLYEMLCGRVPFIGEGYGEILVQHLTQSPLPPSSYRMLPPHLEVVVLKALEKRMDMRYPNMDEFMRAMSDPVGYVEAHGGPPQFLVRQLMPSNAPFEFNRMPPVAYTPLPGSLMKPSGVYMTPVPGANPSGIYTTPVPGMASSTTLAGATGEAQPKKSKAGFVVAGLLVVVGAAIAIGVVVSGGGGKNERHAGSGGTGSVASTTPDADVTPPPVADAAVATGADAVATDAGTGSGSDATVATAWILKVASTPVGATVWIDGKSTGKKTPAEIEITSETASVAIRRDGFSTPAARTMKRGGGDKLDFGALKKKSTGTGTNTGSGKIDTGLERP